MRQGLIPVICALFIIFMAGCCDRHRDDCIRCTGCFNSWTECESDWRNDSITWEDHRDQKIAESQYSTDHCELVIE